jgi:hypothetical protein
MSITISDLNGNTMGISTNPESNNVMNGQTSISALPIAMTMVPKAPYQTMKNFTGTITTSTSVTVAATLYTVTTGKTFYLTDVAFCNNSANVSQVSVNASASLNTAPVIIGHSLNTSPFELTNIGTEPSIAGGTAITAQTGVTTTATTVTYFVAGYEQ